MDITKTLNAIIILNSKGERCLVKWFTAYKNSEQFEKKLYAKIKPLTKIGDKILLMDGMLIIHRFITDLHFYVVGNTKDNPLILDSVMGCLVEVITTILNKNVEQSLFEANLAQIILALDEICDGGLLLETDPNLVIQRISLKEDADQSMASKLQYATEHIKFPWIRS